MTPVETVERGGFTARIYQDEYADYPDWDEPSPEEVKAFEAGEVYGFIITDSAGDDVYNCWGFYGWEYALAVVSDELYRLVNDQHTRRTRLYRELVNR